MKFTIEGFSQEKLTEHKLDCRDAVFLSWFVDFQATGKMRFHVENGNVYHWIDHSTAIKELPILGISRTDSMSRYLSGLIEKGAIERHVIRRGQDKGTEVYYRVVPDLVYELTSDGNEAEQSSNEEHMAELPSATHGPNAESDSSTMIPPEQRTKGAAAVDARTSEPQPQNEDTTKEPPPPKLDSRKEPDAVETFRTAMQAQIPGWYTTTDGEAYLRRFAAKYGVEELERVRREYLDLETRKNTEYRHLKGPTFYKQFCQERLAKRAHEIDQKPKPKPVPLAICEDCGREVSRGSVGDWDGVVLCRECFKKRQEAEDISPEDIAKAKEIAEDLAKAKSFAGRTA